MGFLFIIFVTIVGYLLASLFSWSFYMDDWNLFSNIIKWVVIIIDVLALKDIITGDDKQR